MNVAELTAFCDIRLDLMKWRAWARELNSDDSLQRFIAQMGLYNNLIRCGFYPYYAARMAHGLEDCCLPDRYSP